VVCDDGVFCNGLETCDPTTGACSNPAKANGTSCSDGNACTTDDACQNGSCVGGPPPNCDDGNVCTDDSCDPTRGCVHADNTAPCDDGNACTQTDTCQAGTCTGSNPVTCTGTNQCKSCDPTTGQCIVPKANGVAILSADDRDRT